MKGRAFYFYAIGSGIDFDLMARDGQGTFRCRVADAEWAFMLAGHRSPTAAGVVSLVIMTSDEPSSSPNEGRVVNFRRNRAGARTSPPSAGPTPVEDLAKYERDESADDYRHRMTVNIIAFAFIVALIGAGLWLADTMARMRKDQDCVLSGRRGCTPVDVERKDRW